MKKKVLGGGWHIYYPISSWYWDSYLSNINSPWVTSWTNSLSSYRTRKLERGAKSINPPYLTRGELLESLCIPFTPYQLLDQQLGKEQKEHWMDKLQQLHGVRGPKQLLFLVQAKPGSI